MTQQELNEETAALVRAAIDAGELTGEKVKQVSEGTGISVRTLYRRLRGDSNWKANETARIARFLGRKPSDFIVD